MKANLERLGSLLDDLYKFMHEKRAQNPADIYGHMSLYVIGNSKKSAMLMALTGHRFFYYYWVNGQTFVGPELENDKYPQVKPVSWEEYMGQWPLEQLSSSYYALNG